MSTPEPGPIVWLDPPSRPKTPSKYQHIYEACREHPGAWALMPAGAKPTGRRPEGFTVATRRGHEDGGKFVLDSMDDLRVFVRYDLPKP